MEWTALSIAALCALTTLWLARSLRATRVQLNAYESEITDLRSVLSHADDDTEVEADLRISIELLDPVGLAKRESHLAKVAALPAPHVVKRKTYEQVVKQTVDQMKDRGVDANVELIVV